MQIIFESRDPEAVQMREMAVNRLRFVMGRAARALLRSVRNVKQPTRQHGRSEPWQRRSFMAFDG
jgi:hypothetical protein